MVTKRQALEALDECMRGGGGYGTVVEFIEQSQPVPRAYGCHVEADIEGVDLNCVLDHGRPQDCGYAWEGMRREDCPYWLEIESP